MLQWCPHLLFLGSACNVLIPSEDVSASSSIEFLKIALVRQFSADAVATMLKSLRLSSVRQYESCWRRFQDYITQYPITSTAKAVVIDFLNWLTFTGNRAPVSAHYAALADPLYFRLSISVEEWTLALLKRGIRARNVTVHRDASQCPFIRVPAFMEEGSVHPLCPVHALRDYMSCTTGVCEDNLFCSFVSCKPLTPRTVAWLLCRIIEDADPGKAPRTHGVRCVATSLAFLRTHSVVRLEGSPCLSEQRGGEILHIEMDGRLTGERYISHQVTRFGMNSNLGRLYRTSQHEPPKPPTPPSPPRDF
ncbi:hypothetical protein E2C01_032316 [Portunus trituberculatus]|uniref:Uncharacterized protein n=1 Tax=Portunus trituberculatus TaxID=210409 RepID=A0A5B7EV10_PORTR|nr:hypothetical protein [Portunus trituberculatus]